MLPATKDSFARNLEVLVRKFDADSDTYRSAGYPEAQARNHFINPFFKALGWDVDNEAGVPYHLCEVWVEAGETTGRPDYTFRLDGQTKFFVEAKAPSVELDNETHILQAKRYAWNSQSRDVLFAGLTDFEEFRFFDATLTPDRERAFVGEAFHLVYKEYLGKIDLLWELSPPRVAVGSLEQFLKRDKLSIKYRVPPDKRFLDDLSEWRLELARSIHAKTAGLDASLLSDIVQRLLDRIVFIRIAEDRKVIESRQLHEIVEVWEAHGGKIPIMNGLVELFRDINEEFNGEIFKSHPCEEVKLESSVVAKIIRKLYPPKSPYRFDVLSVEMLGSVYERYLENILVISGKRVNSVKKPELRKKSGIYYTPKYVVDYIVKNSVGKLVERKKPDDIAKLRIVDPACGSGSFLISAFQFLVDWHTNYYREFPQEAMPDSIFPETAKHGDDIRLSFHAKTRIMHQNLYGVDIDPQAVEITMMSIYLKALENEFGMLGTKHERLPELKFNIRCGNSLVSPDIVDDVELDAKRLQPIRPFDWNAKEEGFGDILKAGGFDAVIGNPPWGAEFSGPEKTYVDKHYKLGVGKYESYIYFLERALGLLKRGGHLGFIVPSFWISRSQTEALKKALLTEVVPKSCIILPETVFEGVKMDSCILLASKEAAKADSVVIVAEIDDEHLPLFEVGDYAKILYPAKLADWEANKRFRFNPRVTVTDVPLISQIEKDSVPFGSLVSLTQGLTLYRLSTLTEMYGKAKAIKTVEERRFHSDRKKNKTFKKELLGRDVDRYFVAWNGKSWVSYGPWLAHAVDEKFFHGPRLVVQKIRNPSLRRRLVVGYLDDKETYSAGVLLNAISNHDSYSLFYAMGLLNSRLLSYWYRKMILDVSIRVIDLKDVPIKSIDFEDHAQKAKHDTVVELVKEMIALKKATGGAENKKILECDAKIEQIVFELYGIPKESRPAVVQEITE
jgi:type I restriction-modification system DNA methylase subunit